MAKITTANGPSGPTVPGPVGAAGSLQTEDGVWRPASSLIPGGGVSSAFGRSGAVVAQSGDYTAAQVGADPAGTAVAVVAASATSILTLVTPPVTFSQSPYAAAADAIVPVDTTSGTVVVKLPSGPAAGTLVVAKMVTLGGSNEVTIETQGPDVFNKTGGGTSLNLTLQAQGVILQYGGVGTAGAGAGIWTDISDDLPLTQLNALYDAAGAAATAQSTAETYALNLQPTSGSPLATTKGGTGGSYASFAAALAAAGITPPAPSANFKPANPTPTSTTSMVMMGLGQAGSGQALVYTPTGTGKVKVDIRASVSSEGATAIVTVGPRYGTGTAPVPAVTATVSSGTGSAAAFTATNSFTAGQQVYVGGTTQPTNFVQGTAYFVAASPAPTSSVFYLSATNGGSAIAYSSAGAAVTVGAVVTGTRFGVPADDAVRASNPGTAGQFLTPWSANDDLALAPNTTYWFDLALETTTAADTAQAGNISATFAEQVS
jgi:hypothetical protein